MTMDPSQPGAGRHEVFRKLGDLTTDAIRYWEVRRIFYNALLAIIVLGHFVSGWPDSRSHVSIDSLLGLFLLAVLANVAYCAAYVADLFIQLSGFRESRRLWRWAILIVGFAFASVLTHLVSEGYTVLPSSG